MSDDDDATTHKRAPPAPLGEERFRAGDIIAGKYRVERTLGVGGMGVVLAVTHLQLGELYALKFLHRAALADEASVERFLREARAAVRIKSEHVVHASDVGQLPDGAPYLVMEFLSGCDLAKVVADRGPLPIHEAVAFVIQACAGIGEAHAKGIVHRDLKPSNLFLTTRSDGAPLVKVLDFGISKVPVEASAGALTGTHDVFGSPAYMPPEQFRSAKNVDARSDIWALGVIVHELITGTLPFDGAAPGALIAAISADAPRTARSTRPDVSEALDSVIGRCLQKHPADRFSSVAELALALAPFASEEIVPRKRALLRPVAWGIVAAVVVLLGVAAVAMARRKDASHVPPAQVSLGSVGAPVSTERSTVDAEAPAGEEIQVLSLPSIASSTATKAAANTTATARTKTPSGPSRVSPAPTDSSIREQPNGPTDTSH